MPAPAADDAHASSSAPVVASWPRRIGALVIDWFVALLTVSLLTATPVYGAQQSSSWYPLLAFWLEVTLLTGLLGFSVGKRLLGVVVVGPDGAPIGLPRAALRTLLVCLVVPAFVTNKEGRGLQDVLTEAVVTPRVPARG
ncbi:RDD family protein [Solicola sp. PLA-1-18]|uniref:RDD family protein n=1 Tax=Solicola sp. PLA-1-18 TaxID=3380532 RepID=UPI003B7880A7